MPECKNLGIIKPDAKSVDGNVIRIPTTFKIEELGHSENINGLYSEIAKRSKRVIFRGVQPFFRKDIYLDSLNINDLVG